MGVTIAVRTVPLRPNKSSARKKKNAGNGNQDPDADKDPKKETWPQTQMKEKLMVHHQAHAIEHGEHREPESQWIETPTQQRKETRNKADGRDRGAQDEVDLIMVEGL